MTEQTAIPADQEEMFPKTPREIADEFLEHFQADVEAAEKSVYNARVKLRAAIVLRDHAELNLKRAIEDELNAKQAEAVEEGYMIEAAAEEVEDAEVVEEEYEIGIDQPAPGKMVWVRWPGCDEDDFISLEVGPLTRFGEIVANYFNSNPAVDFLAKYIITDSDGVVWDAKAVIGTENYGREFSIARDKGPKVDV